MFAQQIIENLKKQKEALAIPYESIAKRANLGVATVKRAFGGSDISLSTLERIAKALECEINIKPTQSAKTAYRLQVEKKAQEIVAQVIQTSALEAQNLDTKIQERLYNDAKAMIAKMPKSQIWG